MSAAKNHNDEALLLYGTCPDMETARKIGAALLEARLVACVNCLPGMVSMYHWKGTIEQDDEVVYIAKTMRSHWGAASRLYGRLHPYEEPALVALDVKDGLEGFISWIAKETGTS